MATARRRGFTLLETVAAIVILSVAVPPMLWAVRGAQRQRINPMLASQARWLSAEKLEDIIADRHSSLVTLGFDNLNTTTYPAENPVATDPGFNRSCAFLETLADLTTPDGDGGYMIVTVTVTWTNAEGNSRSLAISTVLTHYLPTS